MSQSTKKNNSQSTWSGLVLVVVTLMLISVYFLRMNPENIVSYDIDPNLVNYKSKIAKAALDQEFIEYNNEMYNYKIKYPTNSNLTTRSIEEEGLEIFTVEISNIEDKVTINTMPTEMEGVVRSSINIEFEEQVTINQNLATRIDGSSVKDGSIVSLVIFETNNNIFTIEGTGQNFEYIVSYFELEQ